MLCLFGIPKVVADKARLIVSSRDTTQLRPKRQKFEASTAVICDFPSDDDHLYKKLGSLAESLPTRLRAYVEEESFGEGSGISYIDSHRCSFVEEENICVYFSGEIEGNQIEECAHNTIKTYKALKADCFSKLLCDDLASSNLRQTPEGQYAFILYDKELGRIIAARDLAGDEPMFWGTSIFGNCLMFSSERRLLEDDCADVDYFPAGAFFVSDEHDIAGNISPFRPMTSDLSASEAEDDASNKALSRSCSAHDLLRHSSSIQKVPSQSAIPTQ